MCRNWFHCWVCLDLSWLYQTRDHWYFFFWLLNRSFAYCYHRNLFKLDCNLLLELKCVEFIFTWPCAYYNSSFSSFLHQSPFQNVDYSSNWLRANDFPYWSVNLVPCYTHQNLSDVWIFHNCFHRSFSFCVACCSSSGYWGW